MLLLYVLLDAAAQGQAVVRTPDRTQGRTGGKYSEEDRRRRRCPTMRRILCGRSDADHIQREKELVDALASTLHEG